MENKNKVRKMIFAALLTAISVIIPLQFGFLKIYLGPFTATVGAHVPMFLAMLISPAVAAFVGIGSSLAFFLTSGPVIGARALSHIVAGYVGAKIFIKTDDIKKAILFTAPVHGILEALVVLPFGYTFTDGALIVLVGTIIHHLIDGSVAMVISKSLAKARGKEIKEIFLEKAS
ncbi:ECF transporter S component [Clostridium sp.]|uniref:ECF transporter S component n=1 Tax=Clostridium sp. TaxID=1506 RepID=UPI002639A4DD|nr:ECF transporter S component [Clostridium sp.]